MPRRVPGAQGRSKVRQDVRVVGDPAIGERLIAEGLGIGMLSDALAANGVTAGRLVPVLPEWSGPPTPLYYLYHQQLGDLPKVTEFLKAVRETFQVRRK
ncbi:LysR substrate-binding domain-containing protein [Ensifer adhaerens]|uniref:LysR substrate-binding domain-containing protein n=1 Tax=Ensifer adhaerens TaxID=106592 RepID=UPI003D071616